MFVSSSSATTISATDTFYDVAGSWALSGGLAEHWGMTTNGRLEYRWAEDRFVLLVASVSMTSAASNVVTLWRFAVNGTSSVSSEVQRKISTGTDVGALAVVGSALLSAGDYVTLQVRNSTSATDVTAETVDVVVLDFPT